MKIFQVLEFHFTLIWPIIFEDLNAFWFLHMRKNVGHGGMVICGSCCFILTHNIVRTL